jgi:hypothetical protein
MSKWTNKRLSAKAEITKTKKQVRKRYLTRARKIKRVKWAIILGLTLIAGVIMWFYPILVFDEIVSNLNDNSQNGISITLATKNAPEAQILPNTITPEATVKSVEQQIRDIAKEHNFRWPDYLVRLADCESKLNPLAVNESNNNPSWSKDRGLFQFNSHWQSKISDECAFDIRCSTEKTMEYINAGRQHLWACNDIILARR